MDLNIDAGMLSYATGALSFLLLAVLLLTSWRGRLQGGLLLLAVGAMVLWCAFLALQSYWGGVPRGLLSTMEVVRSAAWFAFLFSILRGVEAVPNGHRRVIRQISQGLYAYCALLLVLTWRSTTPGQLATNMELFALGYVLLAVAGLALVEQVYRNTPSQQVLQVKLLCLGIGAMFGYDLYLYSDVFLLGRVDGNLWNARGVICALTVPLIAVSAARNPQWTVEVFVSRGAVLHTTMLAGGGLYVLATVVAAYSIRDYGGSWGVVLQLVLVVTAVSVLLLMMFSSHLRAWLKVFISKHFFRHKYDYRAEWLRLIRTLSVGQGNTSVYERVIRAIAEIVECRGGAIWMRRDHGSFVPVQSLCTGEQALPAVLESSPLIQFMQDREWVVRVGEIQSQPELYAGVCTPQWLQEIAGAWLVIPLMHEDTMAGFLILVEPRTRVQLNWEDVDLLRSAARQATAFLVQHEAAQALVEGRQFEAFNRMSAFVVHDLKTLAAQLTLVVENAQRHRNNPQFMDDAITTVEHAVRKMNHLMQHLRNGDEVSADAGEIDLLQVVRVAATDAAAQEPVPQVNVLQENVRVRSEGDRLVSVLGHVIHNAQEAAGRDGRVRVTIRSKAGKALVDVADNGVGMDAAFIRERLFRPFDTTKGVAGMGIGAYETREFLRGLGGDVQVISELGKGTTFRLVLPRVELSRKCYPSELGVMEQF